MIVLCIVLMLLVVAVVAVRVIPGPEPEPVQSVMSRLSSDALSDGRMAS